jgi:hypothetical protein
MHPKALTLPHIRQYCTEIGVRFLAVFNSRTVKTTGLVSIKDLHADRTAVDAHGHAHPHTSHGGSRRPGAGGEPNSVFQVALKEVTAFIKSRMKAKREADMSQPSKGSLAVAPSGSGGTSGSLLNVTILDPFSTWKSFQKNQIVTMVPALTVLLVIVSICPLTSSLLVSVCRV